MVSVIYICVNTSWLFCSSVFPLFVVAFPSPGPPCLFAILCRIHLVLFMGSFMWIPETFVPFFTEVNLVPKAHCYAFARCFGFQSHFWLFSSSFLFSPVSLFSSNITIFKLYLLWACELLGAVLCATNTGCCQMLSLEFSVSKIWVMAWHIKESRCSFLLFHFIFCRP